MELDFLFLVIPHMLCLRPHQSFIIGLFPLRYHLYMNISIGKGDGVLISCTGKN